jgi:hypothetical protein
MARTGIALGVVLDHIRGMSVKMDTMKKELMEKIDGKVNGFRNELVPRIDRLERKVDFIGVQIGSLDERLDDLEVVQLPAIRKKVGIRISRR